MSFETLDETFLQLIADLPRSDLEQALSLPYRLGVTSRPRLGWDDYAALGPMRDLPVFVPDGASSELDREPWVVAHRAAGFSGLVRDCVGDGQVHPDRELRSMDRALRDLWIDALGAACGDAARARARIARSLRRHSNAVRRERAAFSRATLTLPDYARIARDKTDFLVVATELMLEEVDPCRVAAFRKTFDTMMLSLQLFDDALDAAEDREVRGASVGELLGYHDEALFAASARIAEMAAARAAEADFPMLASFLEERSRARLPGRDAFLDAMGAWLIVGEVGAPLGVRSGSRGATAAA